METLINPSWIASATKPKKRGFPVSRIFNDLQPLKMAAPPCAAGNQESFGVFLTNHPVSEYQHLTGATDCASEAEGLVRGARTEVLIFARRLDPELFASTGFLTAAREFLLRSPRTQMRALVRDVEAIVGDAHPLLRLSNRLPSKFSLRVIATDFDEVVERYLIADRTGLLHLTQADGWNAYCHPHATPQARTLARQFDQIWEFSHEHPDLRRMTL